MKWLYEGTVKQHSFSASQTSCCSSDSSCSVFWWPVFNIYDVVGKGRTVFFFSATQATNVPHRHQRPESLLASETRGEGEQLCVCSGCLAAGAWAVTSWFWLVPRIWSWWILSNSVRGTCASCLVMCWNSNSKRHLDQMYEWHQTAVK